MAREGMEVRLTGPMFKGRTRAEMKRYGRELEERIGDVYVNTVVNELKRVIKNPTPFYWTKIRRSRATTEIRVDDSGVIYGPWLAGVSRRNSATRFKGYQHWRIASQRIRRRVPAIAIELWSKFAPRLGGRS